MVLFRNKHRNGSCRKPAWDYSSPGYYFVTLCIKNRAPLFGKIEHEQINLSDLGQQTNKCWLDIPNHFPFVNLDEYIIMPDHLHGIIIIKSQNPGNPQNITDSHPVGAQNFVRLRGGACVDEKKPIRKNIFGPQSKNLASIIRGFKIGVTKYALQYYPDFSWQPLYYDHIIRDRQDLERIRNYIIQNPKNNKHHA